MITLENTYSDRKAEINKFFNMMLFFEKKKIEIDSDECSFDEFFYNGKESIELSYQEMINIFKSNVSLMIYNIIEFTVSGLIDCIYDEIKNQNLSYVDVNDSIRKIWRKTIMKAAKDPNANFYTFMSKNEEIIDNILLRKPLEISSRQALPGGNLDGNAIKETFEAHGIHIYTSSTNYRPDILSTIKDNRNNLAHGSVSFVDAVRDNSISDLKDNSNFILGFLEELILKVKEYLENESYKKL